MKSYWFIIIIVICAAAINFHICNKENQAELVTKNIYLKRLKNAQMNYNKHLEYITSHNEELAAIPLDEFKLSLNTIAKLSGVTYLKIHDTQDIGHVRKISLQLKANEQNCYNFIYHCERIINGIFDIQSLKMKNDRDDVTLKLQAQITYFDIKFKDSMHITSDIKQYAAYVRDDIKKHCNIQLFTPKRIYKLNGIIGSIAIINGKPYKSGQYLGNFVITKIDQLTITVTTSSQQQKIIKLGEEFW